MLRIYFDAPISGAQFDALGRKAIAMRVAELIAMPGAAQPMVIGITGGPGAGKTSLMNLVNEVLLERPLVRTFALDAWTANDAARVAEAFSTEVAQLFSEEGVVGSADKFRDRLLSVGDVVSAVIRLAGVKVDVKDALERSPDALRTEVMRLTEQLGKRIVVFVDHLDRVLAAQAIAILQLVERWGAFPYFAFVVALDRNRVTEGLKRVDSDASALDRILQIELPLPAADRALIAEWLRAALGELAAARELPAPVVDDAIIDAVPTLRAAKRLLNSLVALVPSDLTAECKRLLAL